jgi:hypothetical protein
MRIADKLIHFAVILPIKKSNRFCWHKMRRQREPARPSLKKVLSRTALPPGLGHLH